MGDNARAGGGNTQVFDDAVVKATGRQKKRCNKKAASHEVGQLAVILC